LSRDRRRWCIQLWNLFSDVNLKTKNTKPQPTMMKIMMSCHLSLPPPP
jgi:hypothetical protein